MANIRYDGNGDQRCWNCGYRHFTLKRTFGSKAALGVVALLTAKQLKCQRCAQYSATGNAKPWADPASRKFRAEYEAELDRGDILPVTPVPSATNGFLKWAAKETKLQAELREKMREKKRSEDPGRAWERAWGSLTPTNKATVWLLVVVAVLWACIGIGLL